MYVGPIHCAFLYNSKLVNFFYSSLNNIIRKRCKIIMSNKESCDEMFDIVLSLYDNHLQDFNKGTKGNQTIVPKKKEKLKKKHRQHRLSQRKQTPFYPRRRSSQKMLC